MRETSHPTAAPVRGSCRSVSSLGFALLRQDKTPSSAITAPCGGSRPIGKRTRRAKREPSPTSTKRLATYNASPTPANPLSSLAALPRPFARTALSQPSEKNQNTFTRAAQFMRNFPPSDGPRSATRIDAKPHASAPSSPDCAPQHEDRRDGRLLFQRITIAPDPPGADNRRCERSRFALRRRPICAG